MRRSSPPERRFELEVHEPQATFPGVLNTVLVAI